MTAHTCKVCRRLFDGTPSQRYCSDRCRRAMGFPRSRPSAAGHKARYGAAHRAARAAAAKRHRPSDPCARCGRPLGPMGPNLHYDHDERGSYLGFSHSSCNVSAGAVKGNKGRRRH